MQTQINAIKQLLETNNAIASQLEEILIKALGQQAAWENCSTMSELTELEDRLDDQEEIPNEFRWIWQLLWRSRVDLNDARINAEEVGLESFLTIFVDIGKILETASTERLDERLQNLEKSLVYITKDHTEEERLRFFAVSLRDAYYEYSKLEREVETRDREIDNLKLALDAAKKPTDDLQMECDQLRRDLRERDREVSLLETEIEHLNSVINDCKNKEITPNLDAFQEAVDKAVNPKLLEKIAERDRELERVNGFYRLLEAGHRIECDFARTVRDKFGLDEWSSDEDVLTAIAALKNKIDELEASLNTPKSWADQDSFLEIKKLSEDRDRQIQELEITVKNHRDQFENLKLHFEVTLKAIAMNLNALKGERKGDRVETVDGVEIRYRNYNDNLTHRQKTNLVEVYQVAIAEEVRKLKDLKLRDFSFDDIPF